MSEQLSTTTVDIAASVVSGALLPLIWFELKILNSALAANNRLLGSLIAINEDNVQVSEKNLRANSRILDFHEHRLSSQSQQNQPTQRDRPFHERLE